MSVPATQQYNMRSPAVKRILREAAELNEPTYEYYAQPLEDNIFEWHFTVRGAAETDFADGLYHGRIVLPNDYPMKPPSIILLTPNGRFEVNKKICLSISGYHPETWQPCWSIRTVLLAIISFMPTKSEGAIGSLDYSTQERQKLAARSHRWTCPQCGPIVGKLVDSKGSSGDGCEEGPAVVTDSQSREKAEFADFMAKVSFQGEKQAVSSSGGSSSSSSADKADTQLTSNASEKKLENELMRELFGNDVIASTSSDESSSGEEEEEDTDFDGEVIYLNDRCEPINRNGTPIVQQQQSEESSRLQSSNSFLHSSFVNYIVGAIFALIMALLLRRLFMYLNTA